MTAPDLSPARVSAAVAARGGRLGARVDVVEATASTNDDAKRGAREDAPHGAVWVAESQTRGRGRQGRVWHAAPGESLLFSVLLRLSCAPSRVPLVSLVCGLAVRDAVARALGDDEAVLVKWPNDVVVAHPAGAASESPAPRKIAGVLVESSLSGGRVEHVVVGAGVNVHTRAFPEPLDAIATSVALERSRRGAAAPPDRSAILADVLAALDHDVEHVVHKGLGLVHARLSRRDALAGRRVEAEAGDLSGTACGIDPDGRLLVRRDDGAVARVSSGEVHLRSW